MINIIPITHAYNDMYRKSTFPMHVHNDVYRKMAFSIHDNEDMYEKGASPIHVRKVSKMNMAKKDDIKLFEEKKEGNQLATDCSQLKINNFILP